MSILLIDSYDSFAHNLKRLVETASGLTVVTIQNDFLSVAELKKYINLFDAVVIGPGPGHPSIPKDIGVLSSLFDGSLTDVPIPVLGICLGFQILGLSHGASIRRLDSIKHGQVYQIQHTDCELFRGLPQNFESVRYHSLEVTNLSAELEELAYTSEPNGAKVIMGLKHKSKPWYGVQYHPESICSSHGAELVKNFVGLFKKYNAAHRSIDSNPGLLSQLISSVRIQPLFLASEGKIDASSIHIEAFKSPSSVLEICDSLHQSNQEFILLKSASSPGTWSIIGLPDEQSLYITHSVESPSKVTLRKGSSVTTEKIESIWAFVSSLMKERMNSSTSTEFPFVGGLMGIFSYEAGQHITYSTLPQFTTDETPDTKLVLVENCILRNHETGETFIVTRSKDNAHIKTLLSKPYQYITPATSVPTIRIERPDCEHYKSMFNKCQEFLSSGDSYELCLTTNTKIAIPRDIDPWEIYKTLTTKNPSPYSAYFNFDDCVLISSSPERFLQWDSKTCELRPIKGTVKKSAEMTCEKATAILQTPKEIGENLMIVDLIRHDLFQMLRKVTVPKLMQVEEYKTVYQLVSVIIGEFAGTEYSGIDVLSRSLPPGSMTGAPKKRSVEILQRLENSRRGIYSGVCGYWSFENKADWSVIIRSIFHYKNDVLNDEKSNMWRIGAGGAITVLSDCDGEWDELLTKLDSALQAFES